jgi:prepilin-type processing-associated H-X9-DG protein
MSNLKQIDLGLMMYAQDYDGQLFGWSYGAATIGALGYNSFWAPINKPPMTYTSISWFFEPYVKNSQVFYCPSFSELQIGYGYNSVLRYGMAQAAIEYPSQMVAFMDENYSSYLTYSPTSANWNANFCRTPNTSSCAEADRYYGRHLGGVNVAFVDGHVKWMHIETLYNNGSDKPYFDGRS